MQDNINTSKINVKNNTEMIIILIKNNEYNQPSQPFEKTRNEDWLNLAFYQLSLKEISIVFKSRVLVISTDT